VSAPAGPRGSRALRLHRELAAIWATGPGLQRLASVNHSVIGLRIMVTAFVFFVIAGLLGMLTRVQLATPAAAFMDPETYNQVFTLHGSVMLFLFVIPMLEGVAVYLTPKILGARDFASPADRVQLLVLPVRRHDRDRVAPLRRRARRRLVLTGWLEFTRPA
jgi:cytochrome c oxidase subunit I+III